MAGTNEVTSISRIPASSDARHHARLACARQDGLDHLDAVAGSNLAVNRLSHALSSLLLLPWKFRLAALIERQHAFAPIRGRDQAVIGLDLEGEAVSKRHLQAAMDRLLGLAHRDRPIGGDAMGDAAKVASSNSAGGRRD